MPGCSIHHVRSGAVSVEYRNFVLNGCGSRRVVARALRGAARLFRHVARAARQPGAVARADRTRLPQRRARGDRPAGADAGGAAGRDRARARPGRGEARTHSAAAADLPFDRGQCSTSSRRYGESATTSSGSRARRPSSSTAGRSPRPTSGRGSSRCSADASERTGAGDQVRVKRLKLSGFKSFVEPAELRVEDGLTGHRRAERLRQIERARGDPLGDGRELAQIDARRRHGRRDLRRHRAPARARLRRSDPSGRARDWGRRAATFRSRRWARSR